MSCQDCGLTHQHHSPGMERRLRECIEALQNKIEELEAQLKQKIELYMSEQREKMAHKEKNT